MGDNKVKEILLDRTTLYNLFRKAGIRPGDYRRGAYRSKEEVQHALRRHQDRRHVAKSLNIGVERLRQLIRHHKIHAPTLNESKLDPKVVAKVLQKSKYNIAKAAKKLGISVSYLNKYANKHRLRPARLRRKSRRS